MSATTTVAPVGVPARMEKTMPKKAQTTENTAEHKITDLKLLNTRMADKAGKITSAEISSEPTRFMANTMITAISTASSRLYASTGVPVARANDSSKVTAKILL